MRLRDQTIAAVLRQGVPNRGSEGALGSVGKTVAGQKITDETEPQCATAWRIGFIRGRDDLLLFLLLFLLSDGLLLLLLFLHGLLLLLIGLRLLLSLLLLLLFGDHLWLRIVVIVATADQGQSCRGPHQPGRSPAARFCGSSVACECCSNGLYSLLISPLIAERRAGYRTFMPAQASDLQKDLQTRSERVAED